MFFLQGKYSETDENEQITDLLNHVKHLKSEIATLRDHNDELTVQLEYYKRTETDIAQKSNSASSLQKALSNDNDGRHNKNLTKFFSVFIFAKILIKRSHFRRQQFPFKPHRFSN